MSDEQGNGGSGFAAGVGCAAVPAVAAVALWSLWALATTVIEEVVETRAETIRAEAEAAITYAQAAQMNAVTRAMEAQVAQGQALPWLLGAALILMCILLASSFYQQARLRRLVLLAALGQLPVEELGNVAA